MLGLPLCCLLAASGRRVGKSEGESGQVGPYSFKWIHPLSALGKCVAGKKTDHVKWDFCMTTVIGWRGSDRPRCKGLFLIRPCRPIIICYLVPGMRSILSHRARSTTKYECLLRMRMASLLLTFISIDSISSGAFAASTVARQTRQTLNLQSTSVARVAPSRPALSNTRTNASPFGFFSPF